MIHSILSKKLYGCGAVAGLLFASSPLQAAIVFQDTFDNDGSTNTGVGGELLTGSRNGGTLYTDTGSLTASTNFGSHQSFAWTESQFYLGDGFELEVVFTTVATGNPSFTFAFGIIDEVTATEGNGGDIGNLGFSNVASGATAITFGTTTRNSGTVGLDTEFDGLFTEGVSTASNLLLGTTQTLNLTVYADGSGFTTLDSTTESFAAGTFSGLFDDSLDDSFHFALYAQGNDDPGGSFESVTINAIPEPSAMVLLGLGGLLAARRRRG